MEGHTYLDALEGNIPYVDNQPMQFFSDPSRENKTKKIQFGDSPSPGVPLKFDYRNAGPGDPGDVVDLMEVNLQFRTYVTARTIDPRNNASSVYTHRAKAPWALTGSANIQQQDPWEWIAPNSFQVTIPGAWAQIPGDTSVLTEEPTANNEYFKQIWNEI
jgi:hypothetical protein